MQRIIESAKTIYFPEVSQFLCNTHSTLVFVIVHSYQEEEFCIIARELVDHVLTYHNKSEKLSSESSLEEECSEEVSDSVGS